MNKFIKISIDDGQPVQFLEREIIECVGRTREWKTIENSYFNQGYQKHVSNLKLLAGICRDKKINCSEITNYIDIVR